MKEKLSLLPIALFLAIFLGVGSYLHLQGVDYAFYQFPAPVAVVPALILAVILGGRKKIQETLDTLISGAGDKDIIGMCLIYLLAGAFASVSKASGGVDATVNFGLSFIPVDYILPGIFIISGFVATAMGTSMGTIAAVSPIALGIGQKLGIDLSLMAGVVLSGAMFGDNLSIISDTTIAATRSLGCQMRDKFKENVLIALPAAFITIAYLIYVGEPLPSIEVSDYELYKVLPYVAILILALMGMNVFIVLIIGILIAGVIGLLTIDQYTGLSLAKDVYKGFTGMQEIFLLSMFIGSLSALVKSQGGMKVLLSPIESLIEYSKRFGPKVSSLASEVGISLMVSVVDLCTANNTVAIIVSGPLAKEIQLKYQLSRKRVASLLDIFSCVMQGLIPYGAQALLVASSFNISTFSVTEKAYYCWALALVALSSMIKRAWTK
ncbi:Na+/H+ antiporter NhaC family protein [Halobacteriovorax sp. GB3]|uniref:Na+/H+ antiporter NhaC family protein n=1 Tax=Halobacteriovorax sp. GB3 TaxID=2719615 RepID=UPI002361DF1B|nr:Na+/H+ antiporter NhaC family protein [Halobacteriovorax sp. GB3]MDD0853359.1 Na+/H+ antiporter NhaC family protein [Halobacteriovorax sp. GB3]